MRRDEFDSSCLFLSAAHPQMLGLLLFSQCTHCSQASVATETFAIVPEYTSSGLDKASSFSWSQSSYRAQSNTVTWQSSGKPQLWRLALSSPRTRSEAGTQRLPQFHLIRALLSEVMKRGIRTFHSAFSLVSEETSVTVRDSKCFEMVYLKPNCRQVSLS